MKSHRFRSTAGCDRYGDLVLAEYREDRNAGDRTVPPDLAVVFEHMKQAKHAHLLPGVQPGPHQGCGEDINTVVSAGLDFARLDPKLLVLGAISDPTALPG